MDCFGFVLDEVLICWCHFVKFDGLIALYCDFTHISALQCFCSFKPNKNTNSINQTRIIFIFYLPRFFRTTTKKKSFRRQEPYESLRFRRGHRRASGATRIQSLARGRRARQAEPSTEGGSLKDFKKRCEKNEMGSF